MREPLKTKARPARPEDIQKVREIFVRFPDLTWLKVLQYRMVLALMKDEVTEEEFFDIYVKVCLKDDRLWSIPKYHDNLNHDEIVIMAKVTALQLIEYVKLYREFFHNDAGNMQWNSKFYVHPSNSFESKLMRNRPRTSSRVIRSNALSKIAPDKLNDENLISLIDKDMNAPRATLIIGRCDEIRQLPEEEQVKVFEKLEEMEVKEWNPFKEEH